jgi:hypothetical protein
MIVDKTAQCQCGSLRVTVTGEPTVVNACHCKACQRRTGAVMHSGVYFNKSLVRIEGAEKNLHPRCSGGAEDQFPFLPELRQFGLLARRHQARPIWHRSRRLCRSRFSTAGLFGLGRVQAPLGQAARWRAAFSAGSHLARQPGLGRGIDGAFAVPILPANARRAARSSWPGRRSIPPVR